MWTSLSPSVKTETHDLKARMADETERCPKTAVQMKPITIPFCWKASNLTETFYRLVHTHCLCCLYHSVGKLQSLLLLLIVWLINIVSIILSESFKAYWHSLLFGSYTLSRSFCRKASKLTDTPYCSVHAHCLYHSVGKLQSLLTLLIVGFIHTVRLVTRVITRPTNCPS